jgi:DHA2 family multidrug resistance protein-like MFS transporter
MLDAMPEGLNDAQTLAAGDTLGGAIGAAAQLPPALAAQVMDAARAGFNAALHTNSAIGAVIIAGTALMTALLLRGRPTHAPAPATAAEPIEEQP